MLSGNFLTLNTEQHRSYYRHSPNAYSWCGEVGPGGGGAHGAVHVCHARSILMSHYTTVSRLSHLGSHSHLITSTPLQCHMDTRLASH